MKYTKVILSFLFLLSGFANAQSADTMEEEGRLTKSEMIEAKKLNKAMSQSSEFIRQNEIYKIISPMLKAKRQDVREFFNDYKTLDAIKIRSWAENNAQPEKLLEVVKLMTEQEEVIKKINQDNKRLFELYRKAGIGEIQEIAMSIY